MMTEKVNEATRLILVEVYRRLDRLDTSSEACAAQVMKMTECGLIEDFRFKELEIKINGKWYPRP